jgi:hypothetical protein
MDVLKPSPKDLEHGLQLHASSLVFESYGFSPTPGINGGQMQAAIDAGSFAAEVATCRKPGRQVCQAISTKDAKPRSGGCARKTVELPQEICYVSVRRLKSSKDDLTAGQKSAEGMGRS